MFYKKVDLKSKKEMINYLKNHFRYNTMNSWNLSTSYANNLKIYNVIPRSLRDKAYVIMEQGEIYQEINFLISEWDSNNDYHYQAGFNGRNGGYLVMYNGGKKDNQVYSRPGLSIDNDTEFEDWEDYQLKERVRLVQSFDKLCDSIVKLFIEYCRSYEVKEEIIQVPTKIKVLSVV